MAMDSHETNERMSGNSMVKGTGAEERYPDTRQTIEAKTIDQRGKLGSSRVFLEPCLPGGERLNCITNVLQPVLENDIYKIIQGSAFLLC